MSAFGYEISLFDELSKLTYGCTENISQIIKKHNQKIANPKCKATNPSCNCRVKSQCPLQGKCSTQSVIYKATATTPSTTPKTYIGVTEGPFKQRYSQHKLSFTHPKYKQSTTLSKFIWDSKTAGTTPEVSWAIAKSVPAYSNITKRCLLCLTEANQDAYPSSRLKTRKTF